MEDKLSIPLYENPTRQKLWRVVWWLIPFIFLALLATLIFRGFLTIDRLSALAPEGTTTIIRLIKTRATAQLFEDKYGEQEFARVFSKTNREMAIFLNDSAIIGMVDDSRPSARVRLNLSLMLPWNQGELITVNDKNRQATPLHFSKTGITIKEGRSIEQLLPATGGSEGTVVYALLSLSGEEMSEINDIDVPLVYAGVKSFLRETKLKGLNIFFGEDEKGFLYTLSIRKGELSKEDMESLVIELTYASQIKAVPFEQNTFFFDELRAEKAAEVTITNETDIAIVSARDNTGNTVRATQTPHYLLVTNREISLDNQPVVSNTCLPTAHTFIKPQKLLSLLPNRVIISAYSPLNIIFASEEIAFSKNKIKLCW